MAAWVITEPAKREVAIHHAQADSYKKMLESRRELGMQILAARRAEVAAGDQTIPETPAGGGLVSNRRVSVEDLTSVTKELDLLERDYKEYFKKLYDACDRNDLRQVHDLSKSYPSLFSEECLKKIFTNTVTTELRLAAGTDIQPKVSKEYEADFQSQLEGVSSDLSKVAP